jgi:hypothetical protein
MPRRGSQTDVANVNPQYMDWLVGRLSHWFGGNGFSIEVVDTPGMDDLTEAKTYLPLRREIQNAGIQVPRGGHAEALTVATYLTINNRPLPQSLAAYLIDALERGPGKASGTKRGRPSLKNHPRDLAIFMTVEQVCRDLNLKPTRSRESRAPSGCSVVSEALLCTGYKPLSQPASVERAYQKGKKSFLDALAQQALAQRS